MPETPLGSTLIYTARPTVRINGQEYALIDQLIVAMEVREGEGGMSSLELRLTNIASDPQGGAGPAFEDEQVLALGTPIAVYCGDESAPREIFQGTVTALEAHFSDDGAPELMVLAEDALQRSRMARRTAVYENVSPADLARTVAGRLNLTPVIDGLSATLAVEAQVNESDLAFLRRVLARYDADLQVVGTELHVAPRSGVQRGRLDLELHGQLRRARVLADLSHQVTALTLTGWDPGQGARVSARSTGANLGPGSGRTGAEILRQALGERAEHFSRAAVATNAEARAIADALFDHRARRLVSIEGTTEGNPSLRVGTVLRLSGMGPRFDNDYYVVSACHRFGQERGYETDFEAECAYLGRP